MTIETKEEIEYKEYKRMQKALEVLIKEMEANITLGELKLEPIFVLCGRFGVDPTPQPKTIKYVPPSKEFYAYKEKGREQIEHLIGETYANKFGGEYKKEIELLSDAFLYGDDIFAGPIHLDFPYSINMDVEKKKNEYTDGKELILLLLRYWSEVLVYQDLDDPKTTSSSTDDWQNRENYEPSASEYYDRDPYEETIDKDSFEFDDGGSNWAYNERHND